MGFFPFYTDIENKKCLVVGGGKVAYRKIEKLIPFSPSITVVAPDICEDMIRFKGLELIKRRFSDADIENVFMVIGATNDHELNAHISKLCNENNIPVNIVDQPNLCSFYFPSIIKKNNLTISISTEGKSPILARYLREKIETETDDNILITAEMLAIARKKNRMFFDDEIHRKNTLEDILSKCIKNEITNMDDLDAYFEKLGKQNEN